MLFGEDRGGDEHRHLEAVVDRFERGAHRHLGLAVPDVAAQQPVHGTRPFHVALDGLDRRGLIFRFGVGEGVGKSAFPFDLRLEAHTFGLLAYRLDP